MADTTSAPHRAERSALCDLMQAEGPDAPTLCTGWKTADLATHLVVRENNPTAGPGLVLGGAFARALERAMTRTAEQNTYDQLLSRVRRGPPTWLRPVDALMNLSEFFVHHEDVRRGGGDNTPRPAADITPIEDALWRSMGRTARFMTRALKGIGVELVDPQRGVIRARRGGSLATITGRPGEIALFLTGRGAAAHVELGGDGEALSRLRAADLRI